MESVGILRVLLRRPVLLALGALLALGVGALAVVQSSTTTVGYALQRVLVDTPKSLVAEATPKGATSIMVRTTVLADLMAGDEARKAMADELGLRPGEIGVISSATAAPQTETPLAKQSLEVTRPKGPYVVDVSLESSQPIVTIRATAPDAARAAKLIEATTTALALAASQPSLVKGTVRIEPFGKPEVGSRSISPGKKKPAIAVLAIFMLWCTGIVVADGLARRRQAPPNWSSRRDAPA